MKLINSQLEVDGLTISDGISIAPVCHFQESSVEQTSIYKVSINDSAQQIERFLNAVEESKKELKSITEHVRKAIGENEAKIFETHILLLEDAQLLNKIETMIKEELVNAEFAIKSVFEEYEDIFMSMDDEYMKDRGTDFAELKRRVLSYLTGDKGKFLCGVQCNTQFSNNPRIVLTKELTPSMISLMKERNIKGFVTERGGKTSHAAILTRAAEVPYITNVEPGKNISCGSVAIIDGYSNKVIFNPSKEILEEYRAKLKSLEAIADNPELKGPVVITSSNEEVEIYANIISQDELGYLDQYDFGGVGLLRTEFLFYENKVFPDIEEQVKVYTEILKKAGNRPVTFRLFDLGGDKRLSSLNFSDEENPLLGLRGIRYLLKNQKILEEQINAICKASKHGQVKILYPMISNLDELKNVNNIVKSILKKHNKENIIKIGMMFEVPSVFVEPLEYLKEIDFGNLGTNDLVQYLFGVDRNNLDVSYLNNQDHSAVYHLVRNVLKTASEQNIEISLCGEINLGTDFLKTLISMGLKKLSISPSGFLRTVTEIKKINTK